MLASKSWVGTSVSSSSLSEGAKVGIDAADGGDSALVVSRRDLGQNSADSLRSPEPQSSGEAVSGHAASLASTSGNLARRFNFLASGGSELSCHGAHPALEGADNAALASLTRCLAAQLPGPSDTGRAISHLADKSQLSQSAAAAPATSDPLADG